MQYGGAFPGSLPTGLIATLLRIAQPQNWREVFVACSGTFRIERGLLGVHPSASVHSNDVSLFSSAVARYSLGEELEFRFTGDLGFVEDLKLPDYGARVAALIVASSMAQYATGKPNAFKASHLRHYHKNFLSYVEKTRAKVEQISEELPIDSYFAGDWIEHIEVAIGRGAGVIGYPPQSKGGYEKLFAFINDNVTWTPPDYKIYDPKTLPAVLNRLDESGVPYFIYADQKIEGRAHLVEHEAKGARGVYGYGSEGRATGYSTPTNAGEPFSYKPLMVERLTENTKLTLAKASGKNLNFLKNSYLKKTIFHAEGDAHFLVYLDDMLAGGIVFRRGNGTVDDQSTLEVLADFSTTRDGRLAKLIARVASLRTLIHVLDLQYLRKFNLLRTMAYSDHPVAMKYRGSYDLVRRVEDTRQGAKYVLTYESEVRDETPEECYARWWKRDGQKQVAQTRDRIAQGRSEDSKAA